jgi:ribosomal protein L1
MSYGVDHWRAKANTLEAALEYLETEHRRYRETLEVIAHLGTDCPVALGVSAEFFAQEQLRIAIGNAARALEVEPHPALEDSDERR